MIFISVKDNLKFIFNRFEKSIAIENAYHLSKSPIKMYRNYTVCVHVHNLHPGANKFAPPRKKEQICTRVQILKTPLAWPKTHPGANCAHARGFSYIRSTVTIPIA